MLDIFLNQFYPEPSKARKVIMLSACISPSCEVEIALIAVFRTKTTLRADFN